MKRYEEPVEITIMTRSREKGELGGKGVDPDPDRTIGP